MGACAEINEFALTIEADYGILGQIVDKLDLIGLFPLLHEFDSFFSGQFKPLERMIFRNYLCHFSFNLREILGAERNIGVEIIIKAVINSGADCELDLGPKPLNCLCKDMGACMAIGPPAALVGKGQKLNAVVAVNGKLRIIELSIELGCQGRLAKPGADALGDLVCSYAIVILTDGAVRKSDVNHYLISFSDVFNNKKRP